MNENQPIYNFLVDENEGIMYIKAHQYGETIKCIRIGIYNSCINYYDNFELKELDRKLWLNDEMPRHLSHPKGKLITFDTTELQVKKLEFFFGKM